MTAVAVARAKAPLLPLDLPNLLIQYAYRAPVESEASGCDCLFVRHIASFTSLSMVATQLSQDST